MRRTFFGGAILILTSRVLFAAALSNGLVRIDVSDDDGALTVTDLRTNHTWRQAWVEKAPECRQRVVAFDEAGRQITLNCGLAGIPHGGNKAVAAFRLSVKLHAKRPDVEVEFSFTGDGKWRQAAYPYVFTRDGEKVYNLYPHCEGMLVPVRRNHPDWLALPDGELYGGVHSYLMCLGLVDLSGGEGLLTLLPDIESTALRWRDVGGITAPQIIWQPSKSVFDRPYHITWTFSDGGGYVAMAQRYRQFFAEAGLHRTLREKAEVIPTVKNLAGAPIFWAIAHSSAEGREMADRLKQCGVDRCLFAMAVQDAPQSGYAKREELADAIRHVRSLGYEVYRYDQYRDAFRKGSSPHAGFQLNTEAWPDMIVRRENGQMVQAFGPDSGVVCSRFFMPLARKVFDQEFREYEYSARFLDCLGSVGFNSEAECYAPGHPCTTSDTRRERIALLVELNRRGKLAGTECGLDYLIPHTHWFEGATTLVNWMQSVPPHTDRAVGNINSQSGSKTAAKEQYGRLFQLPLDAAAPDTISLSLKYRIPFYSLCHHDEVITTWRWEDGMDQPPAHWRRKNLWLVLYGAPPMYRMFASGQAKWQQQIGQTHRYVSSWVRLVAFDAMVAHRFITPDCTVQESEFSGGRGVVANFGNREYRLSDGQVVRPCDYVIFQLAGDKRSYTSPPGPNVVKERASIER
jgi:hypothetical protein